ncbi:hypothetical protein V8C42DRAFT_333206 [Trichoderma barbatum]
MSWPRLCGLGVGKGGANRQLLLCLSRCKLRVWLVLSLKCSLSLDAVLHVNSLFLPLLFLLSLSLTSFSSPRLSRLLVCWVVAGLCSLPCPVPGLRLESAGE